MKEITDTPGCTYSENEVGGAVANWLYHSSIIVHVSMSAIVYSCCKEKVCGTKKTLEGRGKGEF